MRALISTWDKTGLDVFARGLAELGFELVASGKTAAYLEELGLEVEHVDALTESPEMLGGRVKTLHPRIHAGILARRDDEEDMATLAEQEIEPFDLVCVNLYPFEQVAAQKARRARSTSSSSRGSGRCRASTTSGSLSTRRSSRRRSPAPSAPSSASRSTGGAGRSSPRTRATGSSCTRRATGSPTCSRRPTSCGSRSCT